MNSLRVRLLLLLVAMLALAAAVMGAIAYRTVLAETEALFDYQLRQMALSLRDQGEIAPEQAGALADGQLDFVVQIWTADGRNIYASRLHTALPSRAYLGLAYVSVAGETWRTFSVATRDRVIQVAQPLQIRRRLAAGAALRSVRPLLFVAPVLALAIWWLALIALRPLRTVARDVQQRSEQSLQPLPTRGLPDEVSPLVEALNGLLQRLSRSFDNQRAFVADAAHELRSPLTALKLQLQLLRRAPDDAARLTAIDALSGGIDRAARLVEQMLTLARSEPGAPGLAMAPLDLSETVRLAVADTVPFAISRKVEFELHADAPVPLTGDGAALGSLARNLADNAVRHAPIGSRVELRVFSDAGVPVLQIDDAGPGIPATERERVFDRFYRRSNESEASGTGLGLAIVRSVAAAHGASVTLGESKPGGLRATVRFNAQEAVARRSASAG
ncbi:MAG: two-component sensor histidine kinase [Methylibium sp.]|uniref:ATP-binding protein n=1 Tax=Methylibium sp. TaxID=2067992 RepID=UPI0017A466C1|nr:ATP-binding protein [Methylibium sp.]MBA3597604.1 two-component sensor histidine kinase [Methylibium sp.]